MQNFLNILSFLSLSLWTGSMFFFSFVVAPTAFREFPREMAGDIVGKIFPQYYLVGYISLIVAFISLLLKGIIDKPFPIVRLLLILLMLGCTFYAGLSVHPKAHLQKTVIRTMEDGPEKEIKQKEFSRLHRKSVILNLIALVSGVTLLLLFAIKIH